MPNNRLLRGWLMLACFLAYCCITTGQSTLQGLVQDVRHEGLPAATVLLIQAKDSSLVKGQVSTSQGTFVFSEVPAGHYCISIRMLGYMPFYSPAFQVSQAEEMKDLQAFTLIEDATTLTESVVSARRPFLEQRIDRTIVNVANSVTNAGGTALEVLQRSPGVQVNRLTRSISLSGKEGVVVMINGKMVRQPLDAVVQMLEGMSANNIDHIELIHTPPANFEAEGNAGVIHIALKNTGDEGLNGGYTAHAGYGRGAKYGATTYFNYRKRRLNWFGNYDYAYNLNPQVFTNYRGVQQGADFVEAAAYSRRPHTPTSTQNARLGLDLQVSPKTMVGVLATFFDRNWYMEAENDITYTRNRQVESRLLMPNTETNHNQSWAGNVNMTHQFAKGRSLNLDADIIRHNINNPSDYQLLELDADQHATPLYQLRICKTTPIDIAVAKADYTADMGKSGLLEAGMKLTLMGFDNDVRVDSLPPQQNWVALRRYTSLAELDERIWGGYATWSLKMSGHTEIKAGIRYEYTHTHLGTVEMPDIVKRRYGSWFPSIYLSRNLRENEALQLSYSRRISRPQLRHLAPWLIFSDPTTTQSGNPAVQPSFVDAVRLGYKIKSWDMALSYSVEQGAIRYLPQVDAATNRQENLPQNVNKEQVASANVAFPVRPFKWWELRSSLFANWMRVRLPLEGEEVVVSNFNSGFHVVNTFTLPHRFTLELSGYYNSPSYWGVVYWEDNGSVDIGVQKDFGDKWGKLRFTAQDLFLSTNWYGLTRQPQANLLVDVSFRMAERPFTLTWSNTFGNRKLKGYRQRQTGAVEEMNRI